MFIASYLVLDGNEYTNVEQKVILCSVLSS